jgi:hypothetical protein
LSTSALEGLPDIAVTHLMNLLFEPVLVLPVLDVPLLFVDEPLLLPVPLLPLFFANAEVTSPLLAAVTRDTAVRMAIITNVVIITFLYTSS